MLALGHQLVAADDHRRAGQEAELAQHVGGAPPTGDLDLLALREDGDAHADREDREGPRVKPAVTGLPRHGARGCQLWDALTRRPLPLSRPTARRVESEATDQIAARRLKLEALRAAGVNPYANDFAPTHTTAEVAARLRRR